MPPANPTPTTGTAGDISGKRDDLIEKALAAEYGGRPTRAMQRVLVVNLAVLWSLVQLWTASPISYWIAGEFPPLLWTIVNDTGLRAIHLTFAVVLVYLCFPMFKTGSRERVPPYDWALALAAAFCASYIYVFDSQLVGRPGAPITQDIVVSIVGALLLLEATRRSLGWPMTLVALAFLVYVFAGPYLPDLLVHKGSTLSRAASQMWLTTEGVFGIALGVSASFVFLFVLFGAMLERSGAGNYVTRVAFSLVGHFRGGPAKAAVLASGLHGLMSGSGVANILTCGPVTIPLMKRVGLSGVKAGAIEVAAGCNGQIMPPVMGAAAFLMVEYVHMDYREIVKHAFLPACLAYLSLLYIVHLEALKANLPGLSKPASPLVSKLIGWGIAALTLGIAISVTAWFTQLLPELFGNAAGIAAGVLLAAAYFGLIWFASRYPEPAHDSAEAMEHQLPETAPLVLGGLYFLLPIFVLVWSLMVLQRSPGLAAFYACVCMMFMLVTQRPLTALFRKKPLAGTWMHGLRDLYKSLESGARNMIGIAIATATAGFIVGAVSLTGVGQVLSEIVEALSGGSLIAILLLTAGFSMILGMGLPTTPNYIVVSSLLAPVIYQLASTHGLEVSLFAVHLFVFYFGVMADATPPVALAAFAAAGLSGADPMKTGVQGFIYELRTAILPFVFIFNPALLLLNIGTPMHFAWMLVSSVAACLLFASALQGWFIGRSKLWESALLLVATAILFRPELLRDWHILPYSVQPTSTLTQVVANLPKDAYLRLRVETGDDNDREQRTFVLPAGKPDAGRQRLQNIGLTLEERGGELWLMDVEPASPADKLKIDTSQRIRVIGPEVRNPQPDRNLYTLPGYALVALVALLQIRRRRSMTVLGKTAGAPVTGGSSRTSLQQK